MDIERYEGEFCFLPAPMYISAVPKTTLPIKFHIVFPTLMLVRKFLATT